MVGGLRNFVPVRVRVAVVMIVIVIVRMDVAGLALRLKDFSGQIFFAVGVDINLRGGDSAARHARNFEARPNVEGGDCVLQKLWRHADINQCAQKHVAADAGKTVEVGDTHDEKSLLVLSSWLPA
jgi:hypothetical protein